MRSWMIAFAAGIVAAVLQTELIPLSGCISVAFALLFVTFYSRNKYKVHLLLFGTSFLYVMLWGHWQLGQKLPQAFKKTDWLITGVVVGNPKETVDSVRFDLVLDRLQPYNALDHLGKDNLQIDRIRLAWYQPDKSVKMGDVITVVARLTPPHGLVNPQGFDYERWLLIRGIDATGYVRKFLDTNQSQIGYVDRIRLWIELKLESQVFELRNKALFKAITTGNTNDFGEGDWEQLRKTGTIHLAVISGLHIGFVALVGWWLGRFFSIFIPTSNFALPYITAFSLSFIYLLIAGAGLPAQRAFLMLSVLLFAGFKNYYIDHWTRWWIAVALVLTLSPLSVFEKGFWLSFTAVGVLIWQATKGGRLLGLMKLQWVLLLGMLPLYLFFFSGVSVIAPLINLLAIPLFTLLVPLLLLHLLLSSLGLEFLLPVLEMMSGLFWESISITANINAAFIDTPKMGLSQLFFVIIAVILVLVPKGLFSKWLAFFLLLPAIFGLQRSSQPEQHFTAWVYDVGQGLSVAVEVNNQWMLYDTGPSYKSGGSAFERAVLPHWEHEGLEFLDHLIISHNDDDHAGGANSVYASVDVRKTHASFGLPVPEVQRCNQGVSWAVGEVSFNFLHGGKGNNDNDRSCVLLIESKTCSLLLPGDISKKVETKILSALNEVDWLIAAHHGSNTSSSKVFLNKVMPKAFIVSAGYANRFKHPHKEVISRAEDIGADIFNTAEDGALILKSLSDGRCVTKTMRQEQKRFWR